ncbi:MAG: hypothetical protein NTW19_02535 [Planctomycetota bacterium]|nr:hypothetical protein [Planctomycetota bacterium]
MAVKHGKNLTGKWESASIGDVTNFNVQQVNRSVDYVSSSSAGETKRVAGASDISGSFEMLADAMPSGLAEGATGALELTSDGTVKVLDRSVLVTDIDFHVDVQNLVKATVRFAQA